MNIFINREHPSLAHKVLSTFIALTFSFSLMVPPNVQAQSVSIPNLPAIGSMIMPSVSYDPAMMAGMTIHPDQPLKLDFIITTGDDDLQGEAFKQESQKLINYFLATLTVPDNEMWVNLSPYEKDRIIADGLGITEMGRDMLVQDYILKQFTASLMYPEEELGEEFWKKIYAKAEAKFGTVDIPTNTFNKVWIVPEEAVVYVNGTNVFVSESHLNVMLEEDYLALESNRDRTQHGLGNMTQNEIEVMNEDAKKIIREVILPEIEREVNEGKNFVNLRQIYHSMILATWYKKNLKQNILGQVYLNKNKIDGIDLEDKQIKEKIYTQYVEAFKKGVYDFIKEDYNPITQELIPRKYFAGGLTKTTVRTGKKGEPLSPTSQIRKARRRKTKVLEIHTKLNPTNYNGDAIVIPIHAPFNSSNQKRDVAMINNAQVELLPVVHGSAEDFAYVEPTLNRLYQQAKINGQELGIIKERSKLHHITLPEHGVLDLTVYGNLQKAFELTQTELQINAPDLQALLFNDEYENDWQEFFNYLHHKDLEFLEKLDQATKNGNVSRVKELLPPESYKGALYTWLAKHNSKPILRETVYSDLEKIKFQQVLLKTNSKFSFFLLLEQKSQKLLDHLKVDQRELFNQMENSSFNSDLRIIKGSFVRNTRIAKQLKNELPINPEMKYILEIGANHAFEIDGTPTLKETPELFQTDLYKETGYFDLLRKEVMSDYQQRFPNVLKNSEVGSPEVINIINDAPKLEDHPQWQRLVDLDLMTNYFYFQMQNKNINEPDIEKIINDIVEKIASNLNNQDLRETLFGFFY